MLNDVLGGSTNSTKDDLLVNGMARKILYNEKDEFRLSNLNIVMNATTDFALASLKTTSFFVKGIDTFKSFVALKSPSDPNLKITTDSSVQIGTITVGGKLYAHA